MSVSALVWAWIAGCCGFLLAAAIANELEASRRGIYATGYVGACAAAVLATAIADGWLT